MAAPGGCLRMHGTNRHKPVRILGQLVNTRRSRPRATSLRPRFIALWRSARQYAHFFDNDLERLSGPSRAPCTRENRDRLGP